MWSYEAERLVRADPATVRTAIIALADELWGDRSRVLLETVDGRVEAIAAEARSAEPDVWLTWRIEGRGPDTSVAVRLDELEGGPDPTCDLRRILDRVTQWAVRARTVED